MKIGIDVDGVLTYLDEYQLKYGKKYFKNTKEIDETQYNITDIFNCSKAEREKFWLLYTWKYCLTEPIREDAKMVINKLKEDGHEIHIITGRAHVTENGVTGALFRKMLDYWLKKNGVKYDSMNYCSEKNSAEEKYEICKKIGIDVMIEDKIDNIESLKELPNMKSIICIDAKYNQDLEESEKVSKKSTLWGAYKQIKSMEDDFIRLTHQEKKQMMKEELEKYNEDLKEYYLDLPYDEEDVKTKEKNYIKSLKVGMPFFNLAFKPIIINKEKIPNGNNIIFVSNHLGSLDQFPIISAIGNRPIHFLAASTLLPLKRGYLYRKTGSIFVDRKNSESKERATDKMSQYLLKDSNVFIFPEGTRNRTEKYMLDFKLGAAALAQATGATIVPFAINNNYKPKSGPLIVRVGDPMKISLDDDIVEKTDELRNNIATMVWENIELEEKIKRK